MMFHDYHPRGETTTLALGLYDVETLRNNDGDEDRAKLRLVFRMLRFRSERMTAMEIRVFFYYVPCVIVRSIHKYINTCMHVGHEA